MALTTVTLHGQILDPDGLTPAVGTVTFRTLIELNDTVDNVTYTPAVYVATLDVNGEFTIVLPATDNPDVVPLNWVYQVYVSTTAWRETVYVQLPFTPGITEFADLTRLDYNPCGQALGATPVAPDVDDLFVLKTGDTMSGNLIINANEQINGDLGVSGNVAVVDDVTVGGSLTATYQGVTGDVTHLLASVLSTNLMHGGELTVNADPTKVDIAAASGWIFDFDTTSPTSSPTNPALTEVTWPGVVGLTPAFVPFTWFLLDSVGTLVQQPTRPTPAQRRTHLALGATLTQGGVIVIDQTLPVIPSQLNNQFCDFCDAAGSFSTTGNIISSNGANLTVKKSVGNIFSRAFSQFPNYLDPHNSVLAAQTPVTFRHITAIVGSGGPYRTTIDVANYDPNGAGVLTPVGGGANTSTNFRVWGFGNNAVTDQILIQYGQTTYASLAAAVAGLRSGNYIPQPVAASGALLGWISAVRTAVDLSNTTQAVFTKASKFDTP